MTNSWYIWRHRRHNFRAFSVLFSPSLKKKVSDRSLRWRHVSSLIRILSPNVSTNLNRIVLYFKQDLCVVGLYRNNSCMTYIGALSARGDLVTIFFYLLSRVIQFSFLPRRIQLYHFIWPLLNLDKNCRFLASTQSIDCLFWYIIKVQYPVFLSRSSQSFVRINGSYRKEWSYQVF